MLSNSSLSMWFLWALVLVAQNWSFTFVSRARNSASLKRHMIAGLCSNGIWFASQIIIVNKIVDMMKGNYGAWAAIGTGLFYTACTMLGSLTSHWFCMKIESGDSAVGANKKYAQVTRDEHEWLKALIHHHSMTKQAGHLPLGEVTYYAERCQNS